MDVRIRLVCDFMKENLHKNISLTELADLVNLSASRLRHLFKAEVDQTPTQYLKSLRMQKAKELLETSWLTVNQITATVGIFDESHFVRDFKRTFGLTPAQYRNRFRYAIITSDKPKITIIANK